MSLGLLVLICEFRHLWLLPIPLTSGESWRGVDEVLQLTPEVDGVCPIGYFQCNMTAQCVPQRLNCDGTADCDNASDEWNCVNDVDAQFWDHLFRKQPYARHDDIPIGHCFWPQQNLSCPCRGQQLLCRFQHLTQIPESLPQHHLDMLDLTGNNFPVIFMDFLSDVPPLEILVLKHCNIMQLEQYAFYRFSELPVNTLYLNENKIKSLPRYLFPVGNQLKILILSGNWIYELHDYDFMHLDELIELDLRDNRLSYLYDRHFTPLIRLELLYLNENELKSIAPGMFPMLSHLHTLSLAQNRIATIERGSFPLPRLRHLYLAGNQLSDLSDFIFCDLYELQGLHLNDNKLRRFARDAFACLHNLTSLLLNANEFRHLDTKLLQNLTSLNYIWFHLCRAALHVRVCEPHGDGISSTDHLLDNTILRVSVWIMASIAIVGNLLVLLGRYWYRTRSNLEHSMYLRHLAASDLLMGIYLAIIAIADMRFRGQYIFHDELWRYSGVCAFSGFLSTFSSQSSTLLLTLVTWDRLSSVMNPLQSIDRDRKRVIGRLILLWGLSFGLAAAPLLPIHYFGAHFYGTNGVCLSLYIHEPYAQGWQYSAILFIFLNTFSLIFILVSYMRMLQAIRHSGGGIRSTVSGREGMVATRFAIIIITDCACWLPVICVKMAALTGCTISSSLYAWMAVLVLPVNSALNPILYTLTTAVFKQQLLRYWHRLRTGNCRSISGTRDSTHLTPLACESAVSTSLGQFSSSKSSSGRKRSSQRQISYV